MTRIVVLHSAFSSAHKYENKSFSNSENRKAFGRCFTDYGHGHDYKIEVGFSMPLKINEQDLTKLHGTLKIQIDALTEKLDHEHLNFVIPEFKSQVPTSENILLYFEDKIRNLELKNSLAFIRLFEMENLWSEKYYVTK